MTVLIYLISGEIRRIESVRAIEEGPYEPITIRRYDWSEETFRQSEVAKVEITLP